jgi:8-oxo-dGTP pyrophosphatase MutT (NUDIX family)
MPSAYKPCAYRVSAKAAIKSTKGLLLVKENSEYWDLPGGGVEHFEEPEDALQREVHEEIGVHVTVINKDRLQAWATYDLEDDRPLLFLVYPVQTKTEASKSLQSGIAIGYFTKQDLKTLSLEPHLEKFRQNLIDCAP